MSIIETLKGQRENSLAATKQGAPARTSNPFFGVGPITDMTQDEVERRRIRYEFEAWLEENYRKVDDQQNNIGALTRGELDRGMHRGYPADKVVLDMMHQIHSYFEFPAENKMAVGLGGGHNGFTVCLLHLMNTNNSEQHIFVDTPKPETQQSASGGFFRQSWGTQILELHQFSEKGDVSRVHFSSDEGCIPSADELESMGVKLFIGVGHETTGATAYSDQDIANLLEWLDRNPNEYHAVIDGTSLLGAMTWPEQQVKGIMQKCCMFMPFQKAIGGIAGYFVASFTPQAIELIEQNMQDPAWAIPRHLKIAVPEDAGSPLSAKKTTALGPFYDAQENKMLGGIINTFSIIAFAETTFGLQRMAKRNGSVAQLNKRSIRNRALVNEWVEDHPLFKLSVENEDRRGAAVTLLKVNDPDVTDQEVHANIIAKAKQLLSYEGLTHPNGDYEKGLDVARYINAFPGTPGDFRAWIGGARPESDVTALLDNIEYAYHRAKVVVLEEALLKQGVEFEAADQSDVKPRCDDANRIYKVLIADAVGLNFAQDGQQDVSEVKAYVEANGGEFHNGAYEDGLSLDASKVHFFYQPDLSREQELLDQTAQGQYDALIAAATFIPQAAVFNEGGVRIGAGTGNMGSQSWGGGNGDGGVAPLMNTPSFNSRATAQMVFKGLLRVAPDLPVDDIHRRVVEGDFDTGKNLKEYPTEKLEGKRFAVLGYGNIGREVAKIAKAFAMDVVVYAREKHKEWIESEGFEYASTAEEAARGASFISPHLGLGALNADTGVFANAGVINDAIFNAMQDGSVLVNYDRGEIVDIDALDKALSSGKIRYASVDTDLFKDEQSGELSGPMLPYYQLEKNHQGKLELLPHVAADTEHLSRVEGAKQAVDQILNAIRYKEVTNLKGDLPEGYTDAGAHTVNGVGKATPKRLAGAAEESTLAIRLRASAESMASIWGAISVIEDAQRKQELIDRYGEQLILESNRYHALMDELGLTGPYS